LSADDNDSKTNSGKDDAQDEQNAAQLNANFTQGKAADTTVALIKPSEPTGPSANLDTSNNGGREVSKSTIFRLGHLILLVVMTANREETSGVYGNT